MTDMFGLSNSVVTEVLALLLALLPGLVTVAVIHALTVRENRQPLERIIQALLYTFSSHVLWQSTVMLCGVARWLVDGLLRSSWYWTSVDFPARMNLLGLGICGLVLGIVVSWLINSDRLHRWLRRCCNGEITRRSSRPNEWYDAFYRWEEYVVVHLKDGRRIFGWPRLYPETSDHGHLVLEDAEWLHDDSQSKSETQLHIMIPAGEVTFVEFVPRRPREE